MKIKEITGIFMILFLIIMSACQHTKETNQEQVRIKFLHKAIYDSIKTMNVEFVKRSIQEGKSIAKDSDDYYSFMLSDATINICLSLPDSTFSCWDEVMRYLESQTTTPRRNNMAVKCLQIKGYYFGQFTSNMDSLIYYAEKASELAEKGTDIEQNLLCYTNLGDAYRQNGELAKSASIYRKAIYMSDSVKLPAGSYGSMYEGLALTYTHLYDFEQSKIWWDKSYELWDSLIISEQFNYLNNRGNDYYYQGDYSNCLNTFLKLDSFLVAHPELDWEKYFCKANLVDVYLKLKQPEKAEELLDTNIQFFSKINNESIMAYLYTQQMELFMQQGKPGDVEELIKRHPLPEGLKPEQVLIRLDFLQRYYSLKPDWHKAYSYHKTYRDLNDSLRNERVKMKAADAQMRYERDATVLNQRIYIGEKENELMHVSILLAISVFVAILLVVLVYYRKKQMRLKEEQMLHRIVELRMENIRNRITPHFIYNALNHELLARQEGKTTQLNTLVGLLRQGQMLANVFCTTLKEELDFINLYVKIEGESIGDNFEYELLLNEGIYPEEIQLPSMMIQIFVENAIKHGLKNISNRQVRRLMLKVFRKNNCIHIEVCNNGKPLNMQSGYDKTQNGLRVVSQTIQLLNEKNKHKMSYSLTDYQYEDGEMGCCSELIIPDNYNFNIN